MRSRSVNNPKAEIPAEVNGVTVGTPIKAEPNSIPAADIPETKINNPTIDTDNALKLQIEALRNSEQISRERMEQQRQAQLMRQARLQDMRPASREEKI